MRISDWSSDVCSSDLQLVQCDRRQGAEALPETLQEALGRIAHGRGPGILDAGLEHQVQRRLERAVVADQKCCRHQLGALAQDGIMGLRQVQQPTQLGQRHGNALGRSEEHTSELQSLMRNSYAVFCLKKKNTN